MNKNELTRRLESALGMEAIHSGDEELARHSVDGNRPTVVCLPANIDQVTAALRLCAEANAAVAPWGGGTAIGVGNLPRRIDAVISLKRLDHLIEHDHANLTATLESGITLNAVQEHVAREKQFLPWDIPFPACSTIGGIVAANLNGARRNYYGSVRDLVIGMKVILPTGESIKAGGKVVKNVAGYDMCKLFVGSLGTLGIVTEVTVRVAPVPHASATLLAWGTLPRLSQFLAELSRSVCQPAAVVVVNSALHAGPAAEWAVAARTDGFEEAVARQLREIGAMAAQMGMRADTLRDESHERFWNNLCDLPLDPNHLVFRVNTPRASTVKVISAFQEWRTGDSSPAILGDTAAGVVWMAVPTAQADAVKASKVMALAREHSGHAALFCAPPKSKEGIDVWGPAPPAQPIMKEIKRRFDPQGLLNPGRFITGI
jgi:glycolate oxidase FAD binding subunit